jgi:hypothetical protein
MLVGVRKPSGVLPPLPPPAPNSGHQPRLWQPTRVTDPKNDIYSNLFGYLTTFSQLHKNIQRQMGRQLSKINLNGIRVTVACCKELSCAHKQRPKNRSQDSPLVRRQLNQRPKSETVAAAPQRRFAGGKCILTLNEPGHFSAQQGRTQGRWGCRAAAPRNPPKPKSLTTQILQTLYQTFYVM